MWVGLALSYEVAALPPSSAIAFVAVAAYVAALAATRRPRDGRRPSLESVT